MPMSTGDPGADVQRRYFATRRSKRIAPVRSPYVLRHVAEAMDAIGATPGERVLEIGAGAGRHAFLLRSAGLRVEAAELSMELVGEFRERSPYGRDIPVEVADATDLPDSWKERYDAVFGFFVLHHVRDLERLFGSVYKVLRSGGRFVFVEPNGVNPLYYLQVLITPGMSFKGEASLPSMRKGTLCRLAARAGFVDIAITCFGYFPPVIANSRLGRRLEARLERVLPRTPLDAFLVLHGARP